MKSKTILFYALAFFCTSFLSTGCLGLREAKVVPKEKHLIFQEIFWVGTHYPEAKTPRIPCYNFDRYFKIYNPTDKVLYLDSLCIAESAFVLNTTAALNADNNFTATHVALSNIVMFPGSGTDYPIRPGESKIIAELAIDHSLPLDEKWKKYQFTKTRYDVLDGPGEAQWCKKAANLEDADFEWLNPLQIGDSPYYMVDNNDVPNMVTVFQGNFYNVDDAFSRDYGWGPGIYRAINAKERKDDLYLNDYRFFIPENRSLILFKLGIPVEELDQEEYWWDYEGSGDWHSVQLPTQEDVDKHGWAIFHHRHTMESTHAVRIPNEWVIDAVTICAQKDFLRKRLDDSVDAGYTSVKEDTNDPNVMNYSGYALHRKHDGEDYVDNNNSTIDFEKQPASLLTEQPPVLLFPNITFKEKKVTLAVGQEPVRLKYVVKPKRSKDRIPTWESSDEEVATVDEKGYVTPLAVGKTTITATLPNGADDKCEVTVVEKADEEKSSNNDKE